MIKKTQSYARDREETSRRILRAAMDVLSDGGHKDFGINIIARRAQCDKQLIYRYFGGLEGVADAIGAELASQLMERLKPPTQDTRPETYGALMKTLIVQLVDLLRNDPVTQKIIAWEISSASPILDRMNKERSKHLAIWMHTMRGSLTPAKGLDAPAINAVLIASAQHMVLSGTSRGNFAGMPLFDEDDWKRLNDTFLKIIDSVYGE
ncbi:TetR/AcrR family transcriptional regulator [Asticcacaulis sp. AC402]|uniref:TetR/AcrR family transcriptional regulator n=1 Tax=Asticcacaulis sp. AC402 TaxID=1282361 RepID=UPI0003C3FE90|nr:TetR/AcrR family transcriptional regulator [Asticcacaulis sp. AC402]ESQ73991.1 hypothetical protein ABAC402_16630 [Asticcacaulis sp. AC402]